MILVSCYQNYDTTPRFIWEVFDERKLNDELLWLGIFIVTLCKIVLIKTYVSKTKENKKLKNIRDTNIRQIFDVLRIESDNVKKFASLVEEQ